ncbi:MAG TPA: glycosyltransferase [Anaerolineales bacterium]|nr:glycosyltransferase [Anaerolineales bacterium]
MIIDQELQTIPSGVGERQLTKSQVLKVAYIMSRFPKLTETFILYEMLAIRQLGMQVEVYPLLREHEEVMHPEAVQFVAAAHFQPFISLPIVRANIHFLLKKPFAYLKTFWDVLRANWGSFNFFTGVIGIFPKTVLFAYQMRADKVQHVHAHFASHPAAAGYIIHRLVGIPYSFTAHGSDLHRDRHMLREKVAEAAFVAAISEYNKELIISECRGNYREKVNVVHCGVDTEVFRARSHETPYEKGENPFMILCVGTLHEVKGQAYLIEACRQLRERGLNFECHFVGDGPDKKSLTELVEQAGLSDKVRFHGRLTRDEIARLLLDADVLTAPSIPTHDGRREGIPVVLMEALGSGVPVIASNLSGIPELVNDQLTGLLVPPRDATSLADALERYLKDPELRRRLGCAGREKVAGEFDLNKNAARLAQHFLKDHK